MKEFVTAMLRKSAQAVLKKYRPRVIAITGSVGKTSAKEAIFAVVSKRFVTRTNIKNYNNEFGLPLTILGAQSPKKNVFGWLAVFYKAARLVYSGQEYPQVLVLELGIDRPGDMDYLIDIVQPDIAVLTSIGISHLEFFSGEDQIFSEKSKIFREFGKNNTAILNLDDAKVSTLVPELGQKIGSHVITYGMAGTANVQIINYQTDLAHGKHVAAQANSTHAAALKIGTTAEFNVRGQRADLFLPGVLGQTHVYAAATGIAAGLAMDMPVEEIFSALQNYSSQPGRMHVIAGPHNSVIIDDTYNAAPLSTHAALKELGSFPAPRKIAVLGDMLELGSLSHISHRDLANEIQKYAIDYFVAVGSEMKLAAEELKRNHFPPERIFHFETSVAAIEKVHSLITANCVILVKGSRGMRMEKIVKAIMAEPRRAYALLCGQDQE